MTRPSASPSPLHQILAQQAHLLQPPLPFSDRPVQFDRPLRVPVQPPDEQPGNGELQQPDKDIGNHDRTPFVREILSRPPNRRVHAHDRSRVFRDAPPPGSGDAARRETRRAPGGSSAVIVARTWRRLRAGLPETVAAAVGRRPSADHAGARLQGPESPATTATARRPMQPPGVPGTGIRIALADPGKSGPATDARADAGNVSSPGAHG